MGATLWTGIVLGAIYALVTMGFTVGQLPSGVFNFAQGALVVGGSFLAYQLLVVAGVPLGVALALVILAGAAAGVVCELVTVRPLRRRGTVGGYSSLIATVGMSSVIVGGIGLIWGYVPLEVPFHGPKTPVHALGVIATPVEIVVVAFALVMTGVLHVVFTQTRRGQACLAVAEDREAAMLRGVGIETLSIGAFAAAGALGGVVGLLTAPILYAVPTNADTLALGGFVAIALGGEGSFLGALGGGLLVGLVAAFATRYLGANWSNIAVLILLVALLLLRPSGVGGQRMARSV